MSTLIVVACYICALAALMILFEERNIACSPASSGLFFAGVDCVEDLTTMR